MPGITGWATSQNRPRASYSLGHMLSTLTYPWYSTYEYENPDKTVTLGCSDHGVNDREHKPYTSPDKTVTVCLYGSIYSPQMNSDSILPFIANLYQNVGDTFANEIQGEFFLALIDHQKGLLILANDRYGRRPVYFTLQNKELLYASSLKPILMSGAISAEVDPSALADFLSFAFIPGDKTLLKDVHLLPPASTLTFNLKSADYEINRYWDLRQHLSPSSEPELTILDQMSDTFRNAVDRRLSPTQDNWISLSAGMDSRVVASTMGNSEKNVKAVTSGIEGSYERKVTSKIAKTLGMEHFFYTFDESQITQSEDELSGLIREAINLTDGMRGTASSAMTAFSSRLRRQHGLKTVITGHGGEIAKLDEAYNFAIKNESDVNQIKSNAAEWAFNRLIRPNGPNFNKSTLYAGELGSVFDDSPRSHISSIVNQLDNNLPAEQIASFLFLNELYRKRASLALSVQRAYVDVHVPFYDDDFLAVAVNAPLSVRSKYKVHKHILEKNCPALLNIVLSETRMRPFPSTAERIYRGYPYSLVKRLGMYKQDVPEHYFAANANTAYFKNLLLDEKTLDRGYFHPDNMAKLLKAQEQGQGTANNLVHLLTIAELWHRDFIDTLTD